MLRDALTRLITAASLASVPPAAVVAPTAVTAAMMPIGATVNTAAVATAAPGPYVVTFVMGRGLQSRTGRINLSISGSSSTCSMALSPAAVLPADPTATMKKAMNTRTKRDFGPIVDILGNRLDVGAICSAGGWCGL